ncbi:tripartite tricarboxylate transporter TctB family protein [Brevibacterium album]|uniref:tripartite tricarboxylate transporter TctB family protein n=1 Tax=Brevibacterium album TaxID=417948 RepID=UPI0004282EF8|nr:tripartite tricarboxylate transporter TctB family protein [Brevibacterium album]
MSLPTEPSGGSIVMLSPGRGRALVGPLCGIAAGALVLLLAQSVPVPEVESQFSPRWWPQLSGAAMILFSLAAAFKDGLRPAASGGEVEAGSRAGTVRIALVFAAVAAYGAAWLVFDFRLVTALLLAALVAIGGGRGWKGLVLFPLIVTLVLWLLFGLLLRVPV